MDAILDVRVPEPEATLAKLVEDMALSELFQTTEVPTSPPRECAKRQRPRESDEAQARKRERTEFEAARRASLVDEEARQIRIRELVVGTSRSRHEDVERSTTEGADIAADSTDGVPPTDRAGSGQPDPTAC